MAIDDPLTNGVRVAQQYLFNGSSLSGALEAHLLSSMKSAVRRKKIADPRMGARRLQAWMVAEARVEPLLLRLGPVRAHVTDVPNTAAEAQGSRTYVSGTLTIGYTGYSPLWDWWPDEMGNLRLTGYIARQEVTLQGRVPIGCEARVEIELGKALEQLKVVLRRQQAVIKNYNLIVPGRVKAYRESLHSSQRSNGALVS